MLKFFQLDKYLRDSDGYQFKSKFGFRFGLVWSWPNEILKNLIDFLFKAPTTFENEQNPLAINFLLVVHLASVLNDRAGGSLVLVGTIVLVIFQNLFGFFFFFQNLSGQTLMRFCAHCKMFVAWFHAVLYIIQSVFNFDFKNFQWSFSLWFIAALTSTLSHEAGLPLKRLLIRGACQLIVSDRIC